MYVPPRRGRGSTRTGKIAAWRHAHRRPVDHARHAVRPIMVEGRRRPDLGRGRERRCPTRSPNLLVELHDAGRRRAGAVVALGRLHPHRLRHRGVHRRAGARGRPGPGRATGAALLKDKPRHLARARARGREGRLGQADAAGPGARHRGPRVVRHARRPGRRDRARRQGRLQGRARRLRRRLRRRDQPRHRQGADGGRHRLRPLGAFLYGEITSTRAWCASATSTPTASCASTRCRRSRSTSSPPASGPGRRRARRPPIAPAVANAYLAATGKVFRRLPVQRNERQASL